MQACVTSKPMLSPKQRQKEAESISSKIILYQQSGKSTASETRLPGFESQVYPLLAVSARGGGIICPALGSPSAKMGARIVPALPDGERIKELPGKC